MFATPKTFLKDMVTENDGTSWCPARALTIIAAGTMLYKFGMATELHYIDFATGFAALVAAIGANKYAEGKEKPNV